MPAVEYVGRVMVEDDLLLGYPWDCFVVVWVPEAVEEEEGLY